MARFLRHLIAVTVLVAAIGLPLACSRPSAYGGHGQSLLAARSGFATQIIKDIGTGDRSPPEANVPEPYALVHYRSPIGSLAAYLSADPQDGKKHPAVVWAHGGFGGISPYFFSNLPVENEQSPVAFQQAGFVVMIPSWRGVNDNPGKPEFFYGEVDDLVAAVQHARSLDYVDPNRVYVVGHSTGATLALLAAEATPDIRAAFAFGPTADVSVVVGPGGWDIPFDPDRAGEIELRSAIHFIDALKTPTFCIEGSRSPNGKNFPQLQSAAADAQLHTFIIPNGTHFNILHPLTRLIADKIANDQGPTCNIALTQDELDAAFNDFLDARAGGR